MTGTHQEAGSWYSTQPIGNQSLAGMSCTSCQLQHSDIGFATLDKATGPSSPRPWQQPAHGMSGQRYATQIPRSMGWSKESSSSCVSLHRCFFLGSLQNSLNSTSAFLLCFLWCFLLDFALLNIKEWSIVFSQGQMCLFFFFFNKKICFL